MFRSKLRECRVSIYSLGLLPGANPTLLSGLRRTALFVSLILSGCYVANQSRLEDSVHRRIAVGMTLQSAVAEAARMKFHCNGSGPVDCSRIRGGLMPYSCVERVRVYGNVTVERVEIPGIACAGL
jgi:hypothetical protein